MKLHKSYCVFIGRFQPFHKAHKEVTMNALKTSEHVILVIGSYRSGLSMKNPWKTSEREKMIMASLESKYHDRITCVSIRDFVYSDTTWITSLQNRIANEIRGENPRVQLIGHLKDDSSYYLNFFPQWGLIKEPNHFGINGTDIREMMYSGDERWKNMVAPGAVPLLEKFIKTKRFSDIKTEWMFTRKYKSLWDKSPYPPTFVTADAVVVQAGHVLLVKRKLNPGKGKYALPGGFVGQNELIIDAATRELKEETGIIYRRDALKRQVVDSHVFDHPKRSARGRTITHAFLIRLDADGPLPDVYGDDDAEEALWMPFSDLALHEENFFEDHLHIVQHFITKL